MDNRFFNSYAYTDFHELNLSWVISELRSFATTLEQFVTINALKYADPIQWNITTQYEKNTIVIDSQTGTAYISVAPVPSGVSLTNTDYWTVVFDLGSFVTRAAQNFTNRWEEETTSTATFPTSAGDWLVWGDVLYVALVNIIAGDAYVVNSNIRHITMEELIGHLEDLNTEDKSNIVNAINEVVQALIDEANRVDGVTGNLDNLNTTDKSNLVAAINEVLQTISDAFANIVGNLNNLDTTDKSSVVNSINEVLQDVNTLSDEIDLRFLKTPHILQGSLLIDEVHDTNYFAQGGCYVGNGAVVMYKNHSTTDVGELIAYDIINKTILWRYNIQAYHGQSVCYRPVDNKLYIYALFDHNNTPVNQVIVVDYANPSVIDSIIIPPISTIYSIAYDADRDVFTSYEGRGTVDGTSNVYTEYNGIFDSVNRTVLFKNPPNITTGTSNQGVSVIHDGIAYLLAYDMNNHYIVGYDITNGDPIVYAKQPTYINDYRSCGESQSLIYDSDLDAFYIGSAFPYTGLENICITQLYEIDLYKGIDAYSPKVNDSLNNFTAALFTCDNTYHNTIAPYDGLNVTRFKCIMDAVNYGVFNDRYTQIISGYSEKVKDVNFNEFSGEISGATIYNAKLENNADVAFIDCTFSDFTTDSGINTQLLVQSNSRCRLISCIFNDYTATQPDPVHIIARGSSRIFNNGSNTFNGAKAIILRQKNAEYLRENQRKLQYEVLTAISGTTSYSYTGKSITIPVGEAWILSMFGGSNMTSLLGVALSTSNASLTSRQFIYEPPTGYDVRETPAVILLPGTYYIWAKHGSDTSGTETIELKYQIVNYY